MTTQKIYHLEDQDKGVSFVPKSALKNLAYRSYEKNNLKKTMNKEQLSAYL